MTLLIVAGCRRSVRAIRRGFRCTGVRWVNRPHADSGIDYSNLRFATSNLFRHPMAWLGALRGPRAVNHQAVEITATCILASAAPAGVARFSIFHQLNGERHALSASPDRARDNKSPPAFAGGDCCYSICFSAEDLLLSARASPQRCRYPTWIMRHQGCCQCCWSYRTRMGVPRRQRMTAPSSRRSRCRYEHPPSSTYRC